ncbi:uncharacterized protein GIQ15_05699 [Arthroderma uncinatum]|uniref:uncharacterized protein n=1 Tax=Arthroderma uncinatum TaxID=74035 RepID=UPI00144AA011|nr:uncharacterized protein GIQ15_05699 [Arthroderma uncinatum]KAF3480352.1 hypothetical protein GIQ15_05699 [Arthroderma uncinatum]
MESTQENTEEVYLFNRNDFEKQRLNKQHELLVSLCDGNLLHPSIPKDAIGKLAEVGTGSGIWLDDIATVLGSDIESFSMKREYAGFDISAVHFPANLRPDTQYIVHDILEPFPSEFHNLYDVVHIRLMVLALKKDDIQTAAANVAALLKPGGFFQWEEIETRDLSFSPPSEITSKVKGIMRDLSMASGLTNTPSIEIERAFKELGLVDVIVEDYNSNRRPDLTSGVAEWTKAGAKAALFYAILRGQTVRNEEEARSESAELWEAYAAEIDGGVVPSLPLKMILGKKAS